MAFSSLPALPGRLIKTPEQPFDWRALAAGSGALAGGVFLVRWVPNLDLDVFARGAAWLVGLFTGTPLLRGESGWMVPLANAPITVTTACSATDYFFIVASLIGFQLARRRMSPLAALGLGLGAALPVTIFVNAVRIVTVAYAHPWIFARLPARYEPFLHMLAGAAVFLPSLIALNLLLETYGRHRHPARS